MATTTATKELERTGAPPAARTLPEVDPKGVTMNADGFAFRTFFVRLPEGMIAQDLADPAVWRRVQNVPQISFRRFDKLVMVAHDETWMAEATVALADNTKAVLAKPTRTDLPERFNNLFQDEDYRIIWTGAAYCVERKKDGQRVSQPTVSLQVAERDLAFQYPKRAVPQ